MSEPVASKFRHISFGWARICLVLLGLAPVSPVFAQGPEVPPGMRSEALDDPTLQMTAFEVFVPEKWHFVGRLIQGTSCSQIPFPVFRTISPDGLIILERLPRMDWKWSEVPEQQPRNNSDCLPLEEYESAQVFLRNVAQMLGVEYVGENPIPDDLRAKITDNFERSKEADVNRYRAAGMRPPEERQDFGQAIVRYTNGSFQMKGLLDGIIYCSGNMWHPNIMVPVHMRYGCTATVRYLRAPEDQFDAVEKMLRTAGAREMPQWDQAWNHRNDVQAQQNIARMRAQTQADIAASTARFEQFQQTQDTNLRLHEQFLATMQRGTDMSMARAAANRQAQSTATSNIVDYALNQQTVRDPNTGALNKVSSNLAYTWADGTGRGFQTSDPNANPNGSLPGTWTRQQVVNGDGTPR